MGGCLVSVGLVTCLPVPDLVQQPSPTQFQADGQIGAGVRIADSACAQPARLKTRLMHLVRVAEAASLIELPVKLSNHFLFGMNLAGIMIQEECVIPRPVHHVVLHPVDARRHPGGIGEGRAQENAAIVIADVDAPADRLFAGGWGKPLSSSGPVIDQKLWIVHEVAAASFAAETVAALGQPAHAVIANRPGRFAVQ